MKKNRGLLLVCIYFAVASASLANDFYWMRTSTLAWKKMGAPHFFEERIQESVLESLDSMYMKSPQVYTFFEVEDRLYVQVNCTFDLFEIQGDSLINMYQNYNRGYTCGSQIYNRNGNHYLLGGQGFWTLHMDLLALNKLNGSWELVITKNQPKDYFTFFMYENSSGVTALFGEFTNNRYLLDKKNPNGYFLDWESKEWKEIEVEFEGLDFAKFLEKAPIHFIQTKDYAFWASTNNLENIGWNLIDKETGQIFYFSSRNVDMEIAPYLEIVGNVLTYPAPNGQVITLDLDQIRAKSKEVGLITIKEASFFKSNYLIYFLLFLLSLGVMGVMGRKIFVKRKKIKSESSVELTSLQTLLPYAGQCLTTETLDTLLGIDDKVNFDSRRMKRARLINDLNKQYLAQVGKELILREKNPEDKRFMRYKIQA